MNTPDIPIPRNLAEAAAEPIRAAWLAGVPAAVAQAARLWSLSVVHAPFDPGGQTAWVAPVRSATAGEVVLKVGFRHYEA